MTYVLVTIVGQLVKTLPPPTSNRKCLSTSLPPTLYGFMRFGAIPLLPKAYVLLNHRIPSSKYLYPVFISLSSEFAKFNTYLRNLKLLHFWMKINRNLHVISIDDSYICLRCFTAKTFENYTRVRKFFEEPTSPCKLSYAFVGSPFQSVHAFK